MAHFLSNLATFFSGVVIAAICSWELALLTLVVVPLVLVIGATYTKKMNSTSAAKTLYSSQATSMVQEVKEISLITILLLSLLDIKSIRTDISTFTTNSRITDHISNQNSICICWRESCCQSFLGVHGQTVFHIQRRGTDKRRGNRDVANRDLLFLGSDHMGWCYCSH